jgi:thiamine-monophosphate kinase
MEISGAAHPPESVGDIGEFGLIAELTARLPQGPSVLLGPGDDAAVVAAPDGRVVATTDLLVDGRHFRRDWSSGYDVGRKAAAQNLADVAAMGARPTALLVGLVCPRDLSLNWTLAMADGLRDECTVVSASVVGGDISSGEMLTLGVTALGDLEGRDPVTRSGAQIGDDVVVVGRLGWAAAGLAVLARGGLEPAAVVDAHRRPEPPYAAGPVLARAGATAMCDVSDGLVQDIGHIAAASGVAIDLRRDSFVLPPLLRDVGGAVGEDPWDWVLAGGDDHALVATLPRGVECPPDCRIVGRVRSGAGVTVDGVPYEGPGGHAHFRE